MKKIDKKNQTPNLKSPRKKIVRKKKRMED